MGWRPILGAAFLLAMSAPGAARAQVDAHADAEQPPMLRGEVPEERARPSVPADLPAAPAPVATAAIRGLLVVRIESGRVLVQLPPNTTLQTGDRVLFDASSSNPPRVEPDVVGVVTSVRAEGTAIALGPDERVAIGDEGRVTPRRRTSSPLAPSLPMQTLRVEMSVGVAFDAPGVLGDARFTYHARRGFVFTQLLPSGVVDLQRIHGVHVRPNGGVGVVVGGGLQRRLVAVGLGLGLGDDREALVTRLDRARTTLFAFHARLGAVDGLAVTTDFAAPVGRATSDWPTRRFSAALQVPFGREVIAIVRGGFWSGGAAYSDLELSVRARVDSGRGPVRWYLRGGPALLWLYTQSYAAGAYGDYWAPRAPVQFALLVGAEARIRVRRAVRAAAPIPEPPRPNWLPTVSGAEPSRDAEAETR